jgi:AraC family transcriptional regulator, regulatory protein of adaptative response / DNA-3-methyladenine glycosylase II
MDIDSRICSQARISRDARFDGRFFVGVLSTRIYCRPICPVRTVKEPNVRCFLTAAAAAEAGYRPCLRCRPESSPGTPAWLGTSNTVSRALRLISESTMENEGLEKFAARLGIGSRQLRRLFLRHLGASPTAVAKTQRLHFAKKLIDETNLPMAQIALASGFGSVRRFNAAFRKTYNRTPNQIRRLAHFASVQPENEYLIRLHFRPPFHWDALLAFLAERATPAVEAVESGRYCRTISLNGHAGSLAVSLEKSGSALEVRISFSEPRWLFLIVERLRRMFDLRADPREITSRLALDPMLARRIKAMPGLRVPGCWDAFELAVRAIVGQQVSVKGATTLTGRLVQTFGAPIVTSPPLTHLFPAPEVLAEANVARMDLPRKRAETIRALARAVCEGRIAFDSITNVEHFQSRLRELPGIGNWTAQYIAMRALGDPDAFPASDLGLLRGASLPGERELAHRAESWRPWRAYAAMYLWQGDKHQTSRDLEITRKRPIAEPSSTINAFKAPGRGKHQSDAHLTAVKHSIPPREISK